MIKRENLTELLHEDRQPILSVYLNVDNSLEENQAAKPAWRIVVKNALSDAEKQAGEGAGWQAIRERTEDFFSAYQPRGKGLVFFAGSEFQQYYELPMPVENQHAYGAPLVAPLLWQLDEYEEYLIVLVDRERAHFITTYLGSTSNQETMRLDIADYDWRQKTLMPATSGDRGLDTGSNREAFEDMLEAHLKRFFNDVAKRTKKLFEQNEASRIVLGGNEQSAHLLKKLLHDKVANAVIDIVNVPVDAEPHQIFEGVLPVATQHEREQERELLDEVVGFAKAGGRGVLGLDDVMDALQQRRVEMVIAPWPLPNDRMRHDLPLEALKAGIEMELVHGEAAERLHEEGGVAARLYYTI